MEYHKTLFTSLEGKRRKDLRKKVMSKVEEIEENVRDDFGG